MVINKSKVIIITQLVLSQSAVLPEFRMQGIMRMLVEHVLNKAERIGYGAVFLGGNPKQWEGER